MKRTLFYILLPLAVSCAKVSDIENLQKQIDDLTNTKIASIDQQITNIQKSIGDLTEVDRELDALISGLREDLDGLDGEVRQALEALEREDAVLDQRIKNLKTYCEQQDGSVRDWAEATFVTLEMHSDVLSEITDDIRSGHDSVPEDYHR